MKKLLLFNLLPLVVTVLIFTENAQSQTTITLKPNETDSKDASVYSGAGYTHYNHGTNPWLNLRGSINNTGTYQFLIQFDLDTIPSNAIVSSATLSLVVGSANWSSIASDSIVSIFEITKTWDEGTKIGLPGTVSWDSATSTTAWNSGGGDFNSSTAYGSRTISSSIAAGDTVSFSGNFKNLLQDWIDGTKTNKGMIVKLENTNFNSNIITFYSSNNSEPERPYLTVTYSVGNTDGFIQTTVKNAVDSTLIDSAQVILTGIDTALTNAQGEVLFSGLDSTLSNYSVSVSKALFSPNSASSLSASPDTTFVTVFLTPLPGYIKGTAVDSISGNALSDVIVTTTPASSIDTTDSGGNFFLDEVPPGTYTVTLSKTFYDNKDTTSISVTSTDTTALNTLKMVAKDSFGVFINIDFDDGTNINDMQFGFHPEGTDGFEAFFNEAQLPPKPQSGAFLDTRFINGTSLGEGSLIDIRNNDQTSIDYTVHLQRISATDNITVTWDSIGAIGKDFTLIELINGTVPGQTVNMVSNTTHTITNDDVDRILITAGPGTFVTWSNNYAQGWNLVSLGGEYVSNSLGFIFPTANSPAYKFNTGTEAYESVTTLEPGVGYFVDFATAYNVARTATIIDTLSLSLVSGWNMIGTTSGPVALSDIDDPSSVVVSIYKNVAGVGYTLVSDSLRQGEGYWVNASGNGTIELVGEALTKGGSGIYYLNTISDEDKVFGINVDTDYGDQLLNIYSGEGSREVNRSFSLPPMAPYQRTAVRFNLDDIFGMDRLYVTEGESLEGTITIKVPEDNRTLILRWDNSNLKAGEYFLRDGVDGAIFADVDMAEQTELSLSGLNFDQVLFEYEGRAPVVEDYALEPNYPNPFNPETNISYRIKEAGLVKLTIYNILGQEVRTLVRSIQNAGSFTVKWDGRDNFGRSVAGGMYIYRLEAKGFSASRKLLLIK